MEWLRARIFRVRKFAMRNLGLARLVRSGRPLGVLALAAWVAASAFGCSSSSSGPAGGPEARFALHGDALPDFLDVPFPSDVYLTGGHVVDPLPGAERLAKSNGQYITHELGKMDGFGRSTHAFFYVDDAAEPPNDAGEIGFARVDPASLPKDETACVADTSSVFVIDLAETDPVKARIPCRAAFHDDTAFLSSARPVIAVGPARGVVLEEGHRYAAVLTSRVRDIGGTHVRASGDFQAIRDGGAGSTAASKMYADALDHVKAVLGPALAPDFAKVVAVAPYTTHTRAKELFAARDVVEALPAPKLSWDAATVAPMGATRFGVRDGGGALPEGFTASLDEWLGKVDPASKLPSGVDDPDLDLPVRAHDAIRAVGTAVFSAPSFLVHTPGSYHDLDDATFARDAAGNVIISPNEPTSKIWVTFVLPTAPMPSGGYPAVIVQHGLSGSRDYLLALANTIAAKGWVAVAIDSITFGARAPDARYQVDHGTDYEMAPGATYKGPDGISDVVGSGRNGPVDFFGGLLNLGALRDQLRQAAIDTASLVRMLRADPDLAPLAPGDTAPHIDGAKIAYVGDSLGALEGTVAAAIEPHVAAWTLNVDGAGILMEAGNHAPNLGSLLNGAAALGFGINFDHLSESHPLINVLETIIEPADPLVFGPTLEKHPGALAGQPTSPRNLLQIEALYDETLANEGAEALARSIGLGLASPNVGSNAGIVDVKDMSKNTQRVPLPSVAPDAAGAIHDTPLPGVTAVVVQTGPAEHGSDLVRGKGKRTSAIPYALYTTKEPFKKLDTPFYVQEHYRELQTCMTGFFADAFAGQVPRVQGFAPPVRDFDDDGVADDVDADPSDPKVK